MNVLVIQSCPTLCDLMDYSSPGCSVQGILQVRILDWSAIPFSQGSSWPRDWTCVSCTAGGFLTVWATQLNGKIEHILFISLSIDLWHPGHTNVRGKPVLCLQSRIPNLVFSSMLPIWLLTRLLSLHCYSGVFFRFSKGHEDGLKQ